MTVTRRPAAILAAGAAGGADHATHRIYLIIAGAYHHSRFREALVGGVSRDLFDHMTVPVLMSH
jgi:nucleotide-binding universal stress UspA family protein